MTQAGPLDAIIYDFGNVLVGWDPYRAFPDHQREHIETLFDAIDFRHLNHTRDAGGTWDETRTHLASRHPDHAWIIDQYVDRFADTLTGPIAGSEDLIRDLHAAGLRLYGLTNWSAELFGHAAVAAPATAWLDDVVVSGRVHLAKPDPAIFTLAIDRFGIDPARTLFVDDAPTNTAAASAAGLRTHTFTDTPTLRAALTQDIPTLRRANHRVVAGILTRGDAVLLCHHHPERDWCPGVWDLPGGHVNDGEDPRDALVRELAEELGVGVDREHLPPEPAARITTIDYDLVIYGVPSWTGTPHNAAPHEHDMVEFIERSQIGGLELADPAYRLLLGDG